MSRTNSNIPCLHETGPSSKLALFPVYQQRYPFITTSRAKQSMSGIPMSAVGPLDKVVWRKEGQELIQSNSIIVTEATQKGKHEVYRLKEGKRQSYSTSSSSSSSSLSPSNNDPVIGTWLVDLLSSGMRFSRCSNDLRYYFNDKCFSPSSQASSL